MSSSRAPQQLAAWHDRQMGVSANARLLCSSIVLSAACDEDSADTSDDGNSPRGCEAEERDDDYSLGLEKSGARVRVQFVDAVPAPPDRGDNTWTLRVLDLSTGAPMQDMTLAVDPYMPDHMHSTSIPVEVTPMEEPGVVQLDPVNLFMPGLWQVKLAFILPEQASDEVVFSFCVDP